MALNGIDISSYQETLNAGAVAADFVIVKATQGTDYLNPYCDTHIQQALAAGKKVGVYHYADGGDAIAEADWFVNNCVGYIGKAIFVLDWEGTGTQYTDWANRFLQRVEGRIGYKPTIYMSESVENAYDWSAVVAGNYGLWIAKYWDMSVDSNYDMSNAGPEPVTKYWPFYYMWQWTSSGRIDGYGGNLDCNKAYITPEQWDAYAGVAPPPPPAPQPTPAPAPSVTPVEPAPSKAPVTVPIVDITPPPVVAPPVSSPGLVERILSLLPAKDSAVVRAVLTSIQTLLAILVGVVIDPNIKTIVASLYPSLIPILTALAGGASLLLNILRTDVPNWK